MQTAGAVGALPPLTPSQRAEPTPSRSHPGRLRRASWWHYPLTGCLANPTRVTGSPGSPAEAAGALPPLTGEARGAGFNRVERGWTPAATIAAGGFKGTITRAGGAPGGAGARERGPGPPAPPHGGARGRGAGAPLEWRGLCAGAVSSTRSAPAPATSQRAFEGSPWQEGSPAEPLKARQLRAAGRRAPGRTKNGGAAPSVRGHLETAGMCQARTPGKKSALHRDSVFEGDPFSAAAPSCA